MLARFGGLSEALALLIAHGPDALLDAEGIELYARALLEGHATIRPEERGIRRRRGVDRVGGAPRDARRPAPRGAGARGAHDRRRCAARVRAVVRVEHTGVRGHVWTTLFLRCGHWRVERHHGFVPRRVRCGRCAGRAR